MLDLIFSGLSDKCRWSFSYQILFFGNEIKYRDFIFNVADGAHFEIPG